MNNQTVTQRSSPNVHQDGKYWSRTPWFTIGYVVLVFISAGTALVSGADAMYLLSQIALLVSTYFALTILSDQPLINPIQSVVFIFYWWIGVAPVVTGLYYLILGDPDSARRVQEAGMDGQWIVAFGIPLYAIAARLVLHLLKKSSVYASFLMPDGLLYKPITLLIFWCAGALASFLVFAFTVAGIEGIFQVNYLGGTRTDVWWFGVLDTISDISIFATVGIIAYLVAPKQSSPWWLKIIGLIILIQSVLSAVTSGSRGPFFFLFFYLICAYVSHTKKIPWQAGLVLAIIFLFVIDPFVTQARQISVMTSAQSSADRTEIFLETFTSGNFIRSDVRDIRIENLFRGIYPLAGLLTRRSDLFDGYWRGETIETGLQAVIPRALAPDKPDMNVGNFMSRTIGVDLGLTNPSDFLNSIAVSMPFEFLGNYGWFAGVLSFGVIGIFWSLIVGLLVSPDKLSTHPLAPWLVGLSFSLEQALGSYLAHFRDLVIPLTVAFVLWIILRKHL